MENLNTRIYNIFKKLVESRDEYIEKICFGSGSIHYNINGTRITLERVTLTDKVDNKYSDSDLFKSYHKGFYFNFTSEGNDIFILTISNKVYYIPEITSRSEYAQIMDTLDETIRDWENKILSKVESYIKDTDVLE